MNIISFFTGSQKKITASTKKRFSVVNSSPKTVYVVVYKNTGAPIGVFDTLQLAKEQGQNVTHHSCIIYPYTVNGQCKYLTNPVYED